MQLGDMIELSYDRGTIVLKNVHDPSVIPHFFRYDRRTLNYRAFACKYSETINFFSKNKVEVKDNVLRLLKCKIRLRRNISLYFYQREAVESWFKKSMRGVISLPTGSGKTRIALKIIAELKVPTLIVVPTLELLEQWRKRISYYFDTEIGIFGGGKKDLACITISTYDSAYINAEILGNKFMLLIFDEVHHLPSPSYRQIAELNAAPYRLGLSATPEREDLAHLDLPELVGEIIYSKAPRELSGKYIADFDIIRIKVKLSEEEKKAYDKNIQVFRRYIKTHNILMKKPSDFEKLVMRSGLDKDARIAILAWREARKIAFNSVSKIKALKEILEKHRNDRIIIFTENNEMARRVSYEFLIPEITYKTPLEERRSILELFRTGEINAIVTSRVLEEGIDVPEANIAIVISGTGSKREFIQRLGRILRPKKGKKAILYEIVSSGTSETAISWRRRKKV